ncbi:MFS transporter [Pseudarthrobacter sp. J1738]|uniref:MFS transporter n=1 Tax=Pseudarthrobacter sp. J1738 TaxID=3420446 RepID=UPI003D2868E5
MSDPQATSKLPSSNASPSQQAPSATASSDVAPTEKLAGMFRRYGALPRLAGKGFIPLGLFARLPLAMLTVGALTLLTAVSSSYAVGGLAAGAVGTGSAIGAPIVGTLADRFGQRPVLQIAAILNTLAVIGLILAAYSATSFEGTGLIVCLVSALLSGFTCPQVGPLARVRWMAITKNGTSGAAGDLDTAMSYESTADELTFVLGPALVGILASLVTPWLPLALAALLTLVLVPAFAVHPTHRAVASGTSRPRQERTSSAAGQWVAVAIPVAAMVCMGTLFGSTQTALGAFAGSFATSDLAGLLYSVMGLSSAASALTVAAWPERFGHTARWIVCAAAMVVVAPLLLLPHSLGPMIPVLLLLGLTVGPVMVTVFAIGGLVSPVQNLGTVMTMLASGIVTGTAIGSSVAGSIAQSHGYTPAFLVPVAAAVALLLLGAAAAVVVKRRKQTTTPN